MVRHPLLNREDIEKERTVILEEAKMYKDLPQSYVHELLDGLLWPRQPLGMPIIGSVESISRIKRTDLLSFRGRNYIPGNIVVSAAGMLEHERLAELAAESFSFFRDTAANKFLQAKEEQAKPQLNLLDKNTEQTHVALGFHSFRRDHPLKYAVGLLHTILGANMSSRLFNELREKRGLAYEIGTQVKRFQDTGAFVVHAGIDNRKVCPTIRLILDELQKTKVKLASPAELKRAKEFYLGQLMLALEDTLDHMLWIGESTVTLDRTYLLDEVINEVSRLKCEDVREAARCIFREKNLNLALIGPLKDSRDRISRQLCLRQP
jgi:predicted Zn-dependent peptidase